MELWKLRGQVATSSGTGFTPATDAHGYVALLPSLHCLAWLGLRIAASGALPKMPASHPACALGVNAALFLLDG